MFRYTTASIVYEWRLLELRKRTHVGCNFKLTCIIYTRTGVRRKYVQVYIYKCINNRVYYDFTGKRFLIIIIQEFRIIYMSAVSTRRLNFNPAVKIIFYHEKKKIKFEGKNKNYFLYRVFDNVFYQI